MDRETFRELRQLLAELYPNISSIRRIVHDAELEQSRIDFNAAVIDIWHAVLTEAEKVGKLPKLLAIIDAEYGSNERFRQIYHSYVQPKAPSVSTHPDEIAQQPHEPAKPPTQVQRRSGLFLGAFALVVVLITLSTQRGLIGKLLPSVDNPSPTAGEAGSTPVETQAVPLAAGTQSSTPTLLPTAQISPNPKAWSTRYFSAIWLFALGLGITLPFIVEHHSRKCSHSPELSRWGQCNYTKPG